MPYVAEHVEKAPTAVYRALDPDTKKKLTLEVARRGWPIVAVGGGAMAATAWLPADRPVIGFLVLGAEVVLGILAVARLISPRAH